MAIVLANPGANVALISDVQAKRKKGIRHFVPLPKREKTRWGPIPKRKRWGQPDEQKTLSEDMKHLAEVAGTMGENESQVYFLKLKLAENARKRYNPTAALQENPGELSPSPPPQYDSQGKRLNTKEFRYKAKLEAERNDLLTKIVQLDANFKIPTHWKKPVYKKKITVPAGKHPEVNFFGLIVGPRGMTQKRMSKETGCNIFIRGRGSFAPGKLGRIPQEDDNEPMYVAISGPTQMQVDKAYKMCMDLLDQSSSGEAAKNKQLAELKSVLGWGGNSAKRCRICGGVGHPIWKCPDRPGADWAPAQIQCALCGEVTHITVDCKLYNKNDPVILNKAMTLDEEYTKFLGDLGGDSSMSTKIVGAITGNQATSADLKKLKAKNRGEKSRVYRGGRGRNQRSPQRGRGRGNNQRTNFRGGSNPYAAMSRGGMGGVQVGQMSTMPPNMIGQMQPMFSMIQPFQTPHAQAFQQMSMQGLPTTMPYNPTMMQMPTQGGFMKHSAPYIPSQLPQLAPQSLHHAGYQR